MTTHKTYTVFGLTLRSEFVLEALTETDAPAGQVDVTVRRATGLIRDAAPPMDPFFDITPDAQYLYWSALGAFVIRDPATVEVEPHPGVSDHLVSQAFLGIVISLLLELRQILCLHASAVNVGGRAVLFLGDKGAGKSTTSGALLARGHLPITDDLVAVETAPDGGLQIRPGFSRMKLWPDSIAALGLEDRDGDRLIHPGTTKIQKEMPVPIPPHPVPIGAAFVLKRAPDVPRIAALPLPAHAALQMILRYTFMARYGETRLGRDHLVRHMQRCSTLVAQVPAYDLMICEDLDQLDALTAEILRIAPGSG
jgi:hypothetical protein